MPQPTPQLVIRHAMAPRQRWLLVGLAAAVLLGAYGAFEYGRSTAGYDFVHVAMERRELNGLIEQLQSDNSELKGRLAAIETERVSMARERAEVARTIGNLQAEISRQTQELAFFKGIVAQESNKEDIKVQRVTVEPGVQPGQFRLKISLLRRVQTEGLVTGAVGVAVDGQQQGRALRLDLRQMTPEKSADLPYSFRYVENLDTMLILPVDFRPERVTLEIRSSRKGIDPMIQTVVWDPAAT